MKVLLINNFHYRKGGSEAVYFNTAQILQEHGHEVISFSYKDEENVPCEQEPFFVHRKGGLGTLKNYFYNTEAERNLESLLEKERPDIAHVHLFWGGLSASIFRALKKYNVPLVHTVHDYRLVCPGYTFKNGRGEECERCQRWNYYQCALNRCAKGSLVQSVLMAAEMYSRQVLFNPLKNISGFLFVSKFAQEKHIEHHREYADAKQTVLYNYTTPMLERDIASKGEYFLYYGRLSYEKGVSTLIDVVISIGDLKLKVVGTGPIEDELKSRVSGNSNIEFLGYKSGKELFELVRDARFVVVPSEWYENNPMTVIEAYSLGTPVIGANIGGIPEIVVDGETGYRFESRNVEDLARVITKALALSDEGYAALCEGAYAFYQKNFSAEEHYKKLISFYDSVINDQ